MHINCSMCDCQPTPLITGPKKFSFAFTSAHLLDKLLFTLINNIFNSQIKVKIKRLKHYLQCYQVKKHNWLSLSVTSLAETINKSDFNTREPTCRNPMLEISPSFMVCGTARVRKCEIMVVLPAASSALLMLSSWGSVMDFSESVLQSAGGGRTVYSRLPRLAALCVFPASPETDMANKRR